MPSEQFVEILFNGSKLTVSYKIKGTAESAIVYLHGLGNNKDDFPQLWSALAEKQHSILCYDAIGFGNSSKPKDFSYSMQDQAIVLNKLLEKLAIEKAVLVGYSMGGAIALRFHQLFPEKVVSFLSVEGNLTSNDAHLSRIIALQEWSEFLVSGFNQLKAFKWECTPFSVYHSAVNLVKETDSGELLKEFLGMQKPKYYIFGEKNSDGVSQTLMRIKKIPTIMISNSSHSFKKDNPKELCEKIAELIE